MSVDLISLLIAGPSLLFGIGLVAWLGWVSTHLGDNT